jgi:MoxR-like ATPase
MGATVEEFSPTDAAALGSRVAINIAGAIKVPGIVLREVLVALLAEGHVLIEDRPGVGKTAMARALARSIDADYARIQCTSDLLPAEVVGTNVFNQLDGRFEFRPGPVFSHLVLVDEINRASPRTQSGLLECMQEGQVTVDGESHQLERPFMVLATQNPVEYEGTYPLPEAQLDRFMVRVSLGYPPPDQEAEMLAVHAAGDEVATLQAVTTVAEIRLAQLASSAVHASPALREYVVGLVTHTREDARVALGASPRAGLMLLQAAKANAALEGRDHALPDDVKAMAQAVLAHRLLVEPSAVGLSSERVVGETIAAVRAL